MEEILGGLYRKQIAAQQQLERIRQREMPGFRSTRGTPYPVGAEGQILIDATARQLLFWDEATLDWEGLLTQRRIYTVAIQGNATSGGVTPASPLLVPLPAANATLLTVELAGNLPNAHDSSDHVVFALTTLGHPALYTFDTEGASSGVLVDRQEVNQELTDDYLTFSATVSGTGAVEGYTLLLYLLRAD